jgi:lipoyl(octanoyl) transferase
MTSRELWIVDLGLRPYAEALVVQREVARRRITGQIPEDVLLLVEHPPVITLGRSAKGQHLLASPALLQARGVERFEVERGGDVTFHGPGQLVGYPIIDLKRHRKDLHWYLRQVEEALIQALATYDVPAGRVEQYTGVWVGRRHPEEAKPTRDLASRQGGSEWRRKIASIGVHARDWVTWHGFALNVSTDLSYFDLMVPCGIAEVTMTSLANELRVGGPAPDLGDVGARVAAAFGALFGLTPATRPATALGASLAPSWTPEGTPG